MSALAELPEGTVTFLFTDLEGSTRLQAAHPAALRASPAPTPSGGANRARSRAGGATAAGRPPGRRRRPRQHAGSR
jgi:hypothetical protein